MAVRLLDPPRREDRLARRMRLAITDVRNGEQAKQLTGQPGPRSEKERIDEIQAIATRAGLDEAALKGRVTYSEVVRAVDASGLANGVIEVSWKVCSGLTPGDFWATRAASRMTHIPSPAREGVGTFRIEANLSLLANMTALGVSTTRRGWQLHDQRCKSTYQ
jgi:hypothetical protein